jgi:cytidylate kinase
MAFPSDRAVPALLITIDGPAGAGKTTVSRLLAQRLGYRYVDTGALYRAVARQALTSSVALDDDAALEALGRRLDLSFEAAEGGTRLLANGCDITDEIRTPEIAMAASNVSARPVVRRFLLSLQRRLGRNKAAVFEGRDMGTVVFPEADVKFFLDASLDARSRRRCEELAPDGSGDLDRVRCEMQRRDDNDRRRAVAPLRPAADAIVVDSTLLDATQVVDCMLAHIARVLA